MSHIGDTLRGQGIVFNILASAHWSVNPSSLGQTWGADHTAHTAGRKENVFQNLNTHSRTYFSIVGSLVDTKVLFDVQMLK